MAKKINFNLAFLTRVKFGKVVTKECFQYFTKCEMKHMLDNNYITKCNYNILDEKDNIVVKNAPCFSFTDKFDKKLKENGYKPTYSSNSISHDIGLSHNATILAKELGCGIDSYLCENELESSVNGYSRVDGAFVTNSGVIAIEKITSSYRAATIQSKTNYCNEQGYTLYFC